MWSKGLDRHNITGWTDLRDKLVKILQPMREYIGDYVNLQFIRQTQDEHLIDFTERFNDEVSKILGVRDDQKIQEFIRNITKKLLL